MVILDLLKVEAAEASHNLSGVVTSKDGIGLDVLVQGSDAETNHGARDDFLLLKLPEEMEVLVVLLSVWREAKDAIGALFNTSFIIGS